MYALKLVNSIPQLPLNAGQDLSGGEPLHLLLRLVIARLGEMDGAGWGNTRGVLGANGTFVFRRTFPQTHRVAQARAVFAVARSRCQEVFAPANCATLWNLPAEIENKFEDQWQE